MKSAFASARGSGLLAEKWREDRPRERGYAFVRVGWGDLDRPSETGERLRWALSRSNAA